MTKYLDKKGFCLKTLSLMHKADIILYASPERGFTAQDILAEAHPDVDISDLDALFVLGELSPLAKVSLDKFYA